MRRMDDSNDSQNDANNEVASSQEECVICMNVFNRRRTKCHPFGCGNGILHAICTECNTRMFSVHDDACPICRAARVDTQFMGHRHPLPGDNNLTMHTIFGGGVASTPNGAVFFSVDSGVPADLEGPRFIVVQRSFGHASSSSSSPPQDDSNTNVNSIVSEILGDPVVQAAIDGLRNPQRGGVAGFLRGIRNASNRRRAGTQQ